MQELQLSDWLPTTNKEVKIRGWQELDVILFSGDAYVDHPSFGPAVIGRILESYGLRVAIVPQPNVNDNLQDFVKLGRPKLFFGITAGCMDSMLSNYNANKKRRDKDAYTPNGDIGFRPDYATTVYSKILKEKFPDVPILIGGIEASLRRVTHYDYWSDQLMPSILETSGADMLVYGMGEQPLREVVRLLQKGVPFSSINTINQTAVLLDEGEKIPKNSNWEDVEIASHTVCLNDKKAYASNFKVIEHNVSMKKRQKGISMHETIYGSMKYFIINLYSISVIVIKILINKIKIKRELKGKKTIVIVAGCVAQAEGEALPGGVRVARR